MSGVDGEDRAKVIVSLMWLAISRIYMEFFKTCVRTDQPSAKSIGSSGCPADCQGFIRCTGSSLCKGTICRCPLSINSMSSVFILN